MRNNRNIAITWPATSFSGWGVYALNLTIELLRLGRNPLWLSPPRSLFLNEKYQTILKPIIKRQEELTNIRMKTGFLEFDFPVLHSLRNDFRPSLDEQIALGSKNIGIVFFEDTNFSKEGLKRAEEYDLIITGSTWNKNVLIDNGLKNVVNVFQGVDLSIFNPIPNYCLYPGRVTIF